jgi:hypothetical protein
MVSTSRATLPSPAPQMLSQRRQVRWTPRTPVRRSELSPSRWRKPTSATFVAADAKAGKWPELNPKPTDRRAVKRWERRYRDYRHSVAMDSWRASVDAEDAFRDAQMAVAKIDARDMNELALKACLSGVYDAARLRSGRNVAVIGYSVALNLISLTTAVAS